MKNAGFRDAGLGMAARSRLFLRRVATIALLIGGGVIALLMFAFSLVVGLMLLIGLMLGRVFMSTTPYRDPADHASGHGRDEGRPSEGRVIEGSWVERSTKD
ncbi:MAG: hypothetical protein ACK4IT_00125 [Thioalkalivibrionaceae bacterium]